MGLEREKGELLVPGSEKREYPRVAMRVKVRYRILDVETAQKALTKSFDADKLLAEYNTGESIDVSKTGLLMFTEKEIPLKSYLAVNMYISIPGIACACRALAEVVRRERDGNNFKVALKFLKVMHHNLKNYKFAALQTLLEIREPGME